MSEMSIGNSLIPLNPAEVLVACRLTLAAVQKERDRLDEEKIAERLSLLKLRARLSVAWWKVLLRIKTKEWGQAQKELAAAAVTREDAIKDLDRESRGTWGMPWRSGDWYSNENAAIRLGHACRSTSEKIYVSANDWYLVRLK